MRSSSTSLRAFLPAVLRLAVLAVVAVGVSMVASPLAGAVVLALGLSS